MSTLLAPRQLLRLDLPGRDNAEVRVLEVDPGNDIVWLLDCAHERRGSPERVSYKQLTRRLREGDATVELVDPHVVYARTNGELNASRKVIWDNYWAAIAPLVTPDKHALLFDKRSRGRLLRERANELPRMDVKRLSTLLRRFWIGGMTKEAVQPHYSRCGHRKKKPVVRTGRRKGDVKGPKLLPFDAARRDEAVQTYLRLVTKSKLRPHAASEEARRLVYGTEVVVMGAPELHLTGDLSAFPEPRTIIVWATRELSRAAQKTLAASDKEHNQKHRPLRGKAANAAYGPGDIFEIDASPLDIKVRSRLSSSTALTQPVLYLVVDAYSSVIVGFYLSLHHENTVGAKLALHNALRDKAAYLKSLDLGDEDMKAVELPAPAECFPPRHGSVRLRHDRGSGFKAVAFHDGLRAIEMGTLVLPPVRPDMKGAVENGLFRVQGRKYTKTPDREGFGQASPPHDDDGVYDMFQLERDIALVVMELNIQTRVKAYPKSYRNERGTDPSPMDIHMQGLDRFKRPPSVNDEELALNFLRRGELRWSRNAWRLIGFDLHYVFPPGFRINMLRNAGGLLRDLECVYHPGSMGTVQAVLDGRLSDIAFRKGGTLEDDGFGVGEHLMQQDARKANALADQNLRASRRSGFTVLRNGVRREALAEHGGTVAEVAKGTSSALKRIERDLPADGPRLLLEATAAQEPKTIRPPQVQAAPDKPLQRARMSFEAAVDLVFQRKDRS